MQGLGNPGNPVVLLRLSRYVRPSSLRKVPSLATVFTSNTTSKEEEEEQLLIARDQDYLYAHTKVLPDPG